jgi:hypothetical protein
MMKGRKIKREENEMMERIHIVMSCAVLGAIVVLFTANQAGAECTLPAPECGESVDANGDPSGWTVEIVKVDGKFPAKLQPGDSGNPCEDKRGNSIECLQFKYKVTVPEGFSLSQANMKIPNSCGITLDTWQDSSVKIREFEPSTGFGLTDLTLDVITWDALKQDPDNQSFFAVYTSKAGAAETTMELKSEELHYVTILGPTCCSATQTATQKTFETQCEDVSGNAVTVEVDYDECTDVALGASYNGNAFEQLDGAFFCEGDANGVKKSTCDLIQQLGPEDGVIFVAKYLYFGYAGDIYKGDEVFNCGSQSECGTDQSPASVTEVVVNDQFVLEYDACGNLSDVLFEGNSLATTIPHYVCDAKVKGKNLVVDENECNILEFGQNTGGVLSANPCVFMGGRLYVWGGGC